MTYVREILHLVPAFFAMFVLSSLTGLYGQDTTDWTGGAGDGFWTTNTNWEANNVPNSIDEIADFNPASFATPGDQIVTIPSLTNITVRQIRTTSSNDVTINGPGTLTFSRSGVGVGMGVFDFGASGGNLTINNDVSVGFAGSFNIDGFSASQAVTFNGDLNFGSGDLAESSDAGQVTFNGSLSGSGRLVVAIGGSDTAVISITAANTYTGNTLVQRGKLVASGNATFGDGTGALQILGTSSLSSSDAVLELSNLNNSTISNNYTLGGDGPNGSGVLQLTGGDATFTGVGSITGSGGSTATLFVASGSTLTLANTLSTSPNNTIEFTGDGDVVTSGSGAIIQPSSSLGHVTKEGTGTLTFGGAENTYLGLTTINGGALVLNSTGNSIAGALILNSGTSASLSKSNQIGDSSRLTLDGATFNTNGFSEDLGGLILNGDSTLDLGNGSSVIAFDKNSLGWTAGQTFLILNWSGSLSGGGTDQIIFGNDSTGISSTKLSQILFRDPFGVGSGDFGAQILGTGEVVPIPESSTYAIILSCVAVAYLFYRHRIRRAA